MNLLKRFFSVCLIFVFVFSVFSTSVITAYALSENARYYESIPEIVYATVNKPFKIYYNNILSLPDLKIVFDLPSELDKKCFDDHIEITSKIPGDFVISWRVYDDEYVLVDSGEMGFIVRGMSLKNATGLVIGDSTIKAGVVTQTLLDIYEKNNKKLTLIGTNGTYPNLHEGRSGWSASMYCNEESDGIYYNNFYNDGFDFTYYMNSQGYEELDFVIIQLGINDIKSMTLENYSSKRALSSFKKIVSSIITYDSNMPIIIGVTIPPSEDIEKYNNSSAISSEFEHRNNIIHFASDLMEYFNEYENICFSPINCVINSKTQFKDAIHPNQDGYVTIANEYAKSINCIVNPKIQVKAPVINETKTKTGYINISWDATYGAQSYDIIKNGTVIATTQKLTYKDSDVFSGDVYKYKISATCENGNVYTSKAVTVYYLGTPVLKSATVTQSGVSVKWNKVYSAEEYIVYRKTSDNSWVKIGKTTSSAFLDKTAKSGNKYFYTVAATSGETKSSYDNSGVSVYYLAAPKLSSATNKNGSVVVKWGSVNGAKGYNVYRKTSENGEWTKVASTTKTKYTDKNVKSGKNYYYTVKAYNEKNTSSYVTKGIVTQYLSTPKLTKATSKKNGVMVTYGKVTGATEYIVYRKNGNGNWSKIATVTGNKKTTYLDKTAKKGVTYTYTVRAVNGKYMSLYNSKGLTVKDKY